MIADLIIFVILPCVFVALGVLLIPMSIRDRYVLRKFAGSFALFFVLEVGLILIVRLFDKELDTMLATGSARDAWLLFLYKSPPRIMEVIPGAGILAAFFTIGSLIRSNELTAFRAVGVDLYRLVMPIGLFALSICAITLLFTDKIIAPATHRAALMDERRPYESAREVVYREQSGALCFIQTLDVPGGTARSLTFYEFNGDGLESETYARLARWVEGEWLLQNGWTRHYGVNGASGFETFTFKARPLDAEPRTLITSASAPEEMTFAELRRVTEFKRRAGFPVRAEIVQFHHNIAYSFALLVGVMLSLPLSMQFGRFAVAVGFPATLLISFLYWGLAISTFEAMGENGRLPALVAAWLGNVLFAGVAALLFRGVHR